AAFAVVYGWLPSPRWLAAPAVWVLLEQIRVRAFGGAPWGLLGHTQHAFLPLAQLAELTGVEGLSFLVLLPAAALAERGRTRRAGAGGSSARRARTVGVPDGGISTRHSCSTPRGGSTRRTTSNAWCRSRSARRCRRSPRWRVRSPRARRMRRSRPIGSASGPSSAGKPSFPTLRAATRARVSTSS